MNLESSVERSPNGTKQQGAVLITSLVLLLVLSMLGVGGINLALLQERMAGNTELAYQAFQAAEAALRDAEQDIADNLLPSTIFYTDCRHGLCQPAEDGGHVWQSGLIDWPTGENVILYGQNTGTPALPGMHKQPRYIIERLRVVERGESLVHGFGAPHPGHWYRITALGYGPRGAIEAMLQSVYRK